MFIKYFIFFVAASLAWHSGSCDQYDTNIKYTVINGNTNFEWVFGGNVVSQGCVASGKFAILVHGWNGATKTWMLQITQKLQTYRGGCIILMDWTYYAKNWNYAWVVAYDYSRVSNALTRRLQSLQASGVNPENIFMYGHSMGARVITKAALDFGPGQIGEIDLCDSAGPGFTITDATVFPRNAAKNVQCIHTSALAGTTAANCHQDWLMGACGILQPAGNPAGWAMCQMSSCPVDTQPHISHDLCNTFYINAFENDFVAKNSNWWWCQGTTNTYFLPSQYKMGYTETRKSMARGKLLALTSLTAPYNVL